MIKFELSRDVINRIKNKHLRSLSCVVKEKIINQKKEYLYDKNYLNLLGYIERNINVILCGELEKLKIIIEYIEKNHYISTNKLSKIKRLKQKKIKGCKTTHISNYIIEKNLALHLEGKHNNFKYIKEFKESIGCLEKTWKEYDDRLSELFNYKEFTKITNNKEDWRAYDLVNELNVSICPYCNRQYINTLISDEKRARAVLDHFYAKSLYPYLALSLYNLIPCCYFCNSTFKRDEDLYNNESIYPYEEGFSKDAKFETDFSEKEPFDYKYLLGLSNNFKINIKVFSKDNNTMNKINQSKKIFQLEKMYAFHKDYVRDLIRSSIINNKSRIDEIYKSYPNVFKSRTEVIQMLFLNFTEEIDLGKRTLSKLTKDIIEEFIDLDEDTFDE